MDNKIYIGIDPGINIIGISIIKANKKKIKILKLKEINLKIKKNYKTKIKIIYLYFYKMIKRYNPSYIVMENTYLGKNVLSMRRLIQCQTAILLATLHNNKKIIKYYPKTIKLILTGNGNNQKSDIRKKLEQIFKKKFMFNSVDVIDSLAVSICHIYKNKK